MSIDLWKRAQTWAIAWVSAAQPRKLEHSCGLMAEVSPPSSLPGNKKRSLHGLGRVEGGSATNAALAEMPPAPGPHARAPPRVSCGQPAGPSSVQTRGADAVSGGLARGYLGGVNGNCMLLRGCRRPLRQVRTLSVRQVHRICSCVTLFSFTSEVGHSLQQRLPPGAAAAGRKHPRALGLIPVSGSATEKKGSLTGAAREPAGKVSRWRCLWRRRALLRRSRSGQNSRSRSSGLVLQRRRFD
jgi:hypothetical protein